MADPNAKPSGGLFGGYKTREEQLQAEMAEIEQKTGAGGTATAAVPPPAAAQGTTRDAAAAKSVDQLIEEARAKQAAQKTPQQRMQELERKMRLGSDTDSDRKEYMELKGKITAPPAEQKPAEQAPPPDQTSFSDPNFRRTYRAPNGVLHDIYGPGAAQQGVAFHGGPGVPISGSSHPAFIGTAIPDTAGLVEYRIPRGNPLQDRILAQQNGGVA